MSKNTPFDVCSHQFNLADANCPSVYAAADSAVALINYQPLKLLDGELMQLNVHCFISTIFNFKARLVSALPTMPVVGLRECVTDRLLRLDDEENPGLIESEFRRLFTQCRCGKIMTRRVFKNHTCTVVILMRQNVVIDLTADAEDVVDLTSDA
jgi:hypothetical protein